MLTEKGQTLRGILRSRKMQEQERAHREALEAAKRWAEERVNLLTSMCEQTSVGTSIEILDLADRKPSEVDVLRIGALEEALGVKFDLGSIQKGVYAGEGGPNFAIYMTIEKFLAFLETNSAPS